MTLADYEAKIDALCSELARPAAFSNQIMRENLLQLFKMLRTGNEDAVRAIVINVAVLSHYCSA